MARITISPTRLDRKVATNVSRRARPLPEKLGRMLSWGADEHVLVSLAGAAWAYAQLTDAPWRKEASHVLLTAAASALVPHLLKGLVDQTRPDRLTVRGHWHGVAFSGNRSDAFPSGHAVHMGALAAAAADWPRPIRMAAWAFTGALSATRVAIAAHWLSDVIVGFGLGAALEKSIRALSRA